MSISSCLLTVYLQMLRVETRIKEHLKAQSQDPTLMCTKVTKAFTFYGWSEETVVTTEIFLLSFIHAYDNKELWIPIFVDCMKRFVVCMRKRRYDFSPYSYICNGNEMSGFFLILLIVENPILIGPAPQFWNKHHVPDVNVHFPF